MNDMDRSQGAYGASRSAAGGGAGYPSTMQGYKATSSQPWYKTPWAKIGIPVLLIIGESCIVYTNLKNQYMLASSR